MEKIEMNALKIDNTSGVNATNAPANAVEINTKAEDTSKDTLESTEKATQESTAEPSVKHVVTYIGSSEFTDAKGCKWHKNDEQTYDESEYAGRADLEFMIKYGEMKHTIVSM